MTYIYGLSESGKLEDIRYIGKAKNLHNRYSVHMYQARSNKSNTYCSNWIKSLLKQGKEPTIIELDKCEDSIWEDVERKYIQEFKDKGYNLVNLEDGGSSKAHITQKNPIGFDKRTRKKVYMLNTNMEILRTFNSTIEASKFINGNRQPISGCCRMKFPSQRGYIWRYEENVATIKILREGRLKAVEQIDLASGKIINTYISCAEASRKTGVNKANIANCCRGIVHTAKGFKWRFA